MSKTGGVFAEERDELLKSARSGVVVLVDATRPKPGSTIGLEVVQEDHRRQCTAQRVTERAEPQVSSLWDEPPY